MADPHVLTFEKDIENEIRMRSASLADIAASSGVISNKPEKSAATWLFAVIGAFLILVAGVGTYAYYLTNQKTSEGKLVRGTKGETMVIFDTGKKETKPLGGSPATSTSGTKKNALDTPFDKLLPKTYPYLTTTLIKGEKIGTGYILTVISYNEVYKTILDNETLFLQDETALYSLSSSATTTFKDIHSGDIDARVATVSDGKKIYYAFIKPSSILIANDEPTLKILSDAILK